MKKNDQLVEKWHPSKTPTLRKRCFDFSLLKKTLEKLYLKSKEEPKLDISYENQSVLASPPKLSHWSTNQQWNPMTPTLRNINFKQIRKTIEKLYTNSNKSIDHENESFEIHVEKTLKF